MRQIILQQNKNLKYLPISFNNNIQKVKEELEAGHGILKVTQVQIIYDKIFKVDRIISDSNIYQIFGAQMEMLLDILKYLNENIDDYERYELLEGFISEFKMIKKLATKPAYTILSHHIDFIEKELIPLINNHIDRIDDVLKIRNHKSFVRKKLIDKGAVEFSIGVNDKIIQEILDFLKMKCATQNDFKGLNNELSNKGTSNSAYYNLNNTTPDEMLLFFKIMKDREILSKITNKDLSKWLHRKFRYLKNINYSIGVSERTILDKLNVKLTVKEKQKELNIHFRK